MANLPVPFWAEGPIPPAHLATYFAGRSEEVERLSKRWRQRAPARTVVVAPARAGKRSLLNASVAGADVTPLHIRLDRLLPETPTGLAGRLVEAIGLKAPHPLLGRLERHLRFGPPEAPAEVLRQLGEALDRIEPRPLVIFEGAQVLDRLPIDDLTALNDLVATSRAHFASLLEQVPAGLQDSLPDLLGPTGVRVTRLAPLGRKEAADYVQRRLAAARCQADPEALLLFLEYAGGDPASLQLLGARCHDVLLRRQKGRLEESDVVEGLHLALESLPPDWTRILGELKGRARDAFVALALLDAPSVSEVGARIHLDAKNVSVVLGRLVERGAPVRKVARGRFEITHRLLAEWVRKEWTVVG